MVMAFLGQADLDLEAKDLFAVFAIQAVHVVGAFQGFVDPVGESIQHQRMIVQVRRLDEFDLQMISGYHVGIVINASHQNTGEQEVWKHNDPLITQLGGVPQARFHQGEGDAGIGHFGPAKAKALPQQTADFRDIGIGIRVGRAPAHHHQQGFLRTDMIARGIHGLAHPVAGGTDQLHVHTQIPAIGDIQLRVLGAIGIDHRGQVVLHMARGEQHAGYSNNALVATFAQGIQTLADDRRGEFQKAAVHVILRQSGADTVRDALKFADGVFVTATVAAYHNANVCHDCLIHSRYATLALFKVMRQTCWLRGLVLT